MSKHGKKHGQHHSHSSGGWYGDGGGWDGVPDPHVGFVGDKSPTGVAAGTYGKMFKNCKHPPLPVKVGDVVLYGTAKRDLLGEMLDPFDIISPSITSSCLQIENFTGIVLWFPITDFQAPDAKQLRIHCNRLIQFARNGCKVAVFCEGGHGRTGLVLATCIAMLEPDVDPIDAVRERHCSHAVETQRQIEVVFAAAERELPDHWKPKYTAKAPLVDRTPLTPEAVKSFSQILGDERFGVQASIREDVERVVIPVVNPEPAGERELVLPMTGSDAAFSRAVREEALKNELGVRPDGFSYQPPAKVVMGNDPELDDLVNWGPGAGAVEANESGALAAAARLLTDGAVEPADDEDGERPYWQGWTEEEQRKFMLRTEGVLNEEDEWADMLCTLCVDPFTDPEDLVVVTYNEGMKQALHPRCVNQAHKNLRRRELHQAERGKTGGKANG